MHGIEFVCRAAGTPNVRIGVVGAGTERIFEEVKRLRGGSPKVAFLPSKAVGKVLASELPKCQNKICTVLYPASAKAGNEIVLCCWRRSVVRSWIRGHKAEYILHCTCS